jgi:hypothetical protein
MWKAQLVAARAMAAAVGHSTGISAASPATADGLFQAWPGPTGLRGRNRAVRAGRARLERDRPRLNLGVGPPLEAVRERVERQGERVRATAPSRERVVLGWSDATMAEDTYRVE